VREGRREGRDEGTRKKGFTPDYLGLYSGMFYVYTGDGEERNSPRCSPGQRNGNFV
jgi:hypothetical protein